MSLFPAYAGVILHTAPISYGTVSFPRTRGGDPKIVAAVKRKGFFSPHTRG